MTNEAISSHALSLSEVWDALTAAGATIYEWCEGGVATGCQVILVGGKHAITVSDSEGYRLEAVADYEDSWELVPAEGYDDDAAELAASDTAGFFGIIGVPGSVHHDFDWFETAAEAEEWVQRRHDERRELNPALGTLEAEVVTATEAFAREYRDGSKVYFRPRDGALAGYTPKVREIE